MNDFFQYQATVGTAITGVGQNGESKTLRERGAGLLELFVSG